MRGQGKGGVTARGRDFVVIGVPLKKGCHCEGILLREMLSRIERREKGGVRIRRHCFHKNKLVVMVVWTIFIKYLTSKMSFL